MFTRSGRTLPVLGKLRRFPSLTKRGLAPLRHQARAPRALGVKEPRRRWRT